MKASLLIITLLSTAITSVTAGGPLFHPFTHKFSRKSFRKWGEYLIHDDNLNHKYRVHNGYTGTSEKLSHPSPAQIAKCPLRLKDAKISLARAVGRHFHGKKTHYMLHPKEVNEVELLYYINNGKCGMFGIKTKPSNPDVWDTPFFLPWTDEVSSQWGGIHFDDIRFSAGDALDRVEHQVSKLAGGFMEIELKKTMFDGIQQAVYVFKDLSEDNRIRVYVGNYMGTVDWTIASMLPKKIEAEESGSDESELLIFTD